MDRRVSFLCEPCTAHSGNGLVFVPARRIDSHNRHDRRHRRADRFRGNFLISRGDYEREQELRSAAAARPGMAVLSTAEVVAPAPAVFRAPVVSGAPGEAARSVAGGVVALALLAMVLTAALAALVSY